MEMTGKHCLWLISISILLVFIFMTKSFIQLQINNGANNQQIRLRQTESIVEVSTNGDTWVYSNTVPINSVIMQKRVVTPTQKKVIDVIDEHDENNVIVTTDTVVDSNVNDTPSTSSPTQKKVIDAIDEHDRNSKVVTDNTVVEGTLNDTPSTSPPIPKTIKEGSLIDTIIQKDGIRPTRSPRANMNKDTFSRRPVNSDKRNPYNDVLININFKTPKYPSKIDRFNQSYSLHYYQNNSFIQQELPQIQPFLPESAKPDFTIISQATQERLFFIPYLLERWQGSYSIAVYCSPDEYPVIQQALQASQLPDRLRILIYVHTSTDDCVNKVQEGKLVCVKQTVYPINRLRNLAIGNILTTHFILFDMDMWPAKSTYQTLLNLPDAYLQNPYFVTIIPAFSFTNTLLKHYPCEGFKECVLRAIPLLPETKKDLAHCVKRNKCSIFRPLSRTHNYISSDWYSLNKESQVRYLKCFKHPFMEPYVMVRRTKELPLLEEVFINYGFNKVQWVENLRYLGYEFYILSQSFAMDIPHELSSFAVNYTKSFVGDNSPEMLGVYRRYLRRMRKKPDQSRQLLCLSKRTVFVLSIRNRH